MFKRIYEVDLNHADAQGFASKSLVVDLLKIANPDGIGRTTSPGAYGVSDPFAFPFVSVETVVQLRDGNLLTANDNNYPGDDAREPRHPGRHRDGDHRPGRQGADRTRTRPR